MQGGCEKRPWRSSCAMFSSWLTQGSFLSPSRVVLAREGWAGRKGTGWCSTPRQSGWIICLIWEESLCCGMAIDITNEFNLAIITQQLSQMEENNINNYKGVMLCTRPNESPKPANERPFCSMITVHEQIGLVPGKREGEAIVTTRKRDSNVYLKRHKDWLSNLAKRQKERMQHVQEEQKKKDQLFMKVREQAAMDRINSRKMKEQYQSATAAVLNILDEDVDNAKPAPLTAANLQLLNAQPEVQQNSDEDDAYIRQLIAQAKRKEKLLKADEPKSKDKFVKPEWALTEAERNKKEQDEMNDLLNFFQKKEFKQYVEDIEVQAIMKLLKQKITQIKKEKNWKQKQQAAIRERHPPTDLKTEGQVSQGNASVASSKTAKAIEDLKLKAAKKQQGEQEWQTSTVAKETKANLEDRIAKHVADQILRNYKQLQNVHSNNSVRKLLEQEARRQLLQKQYNEHLPKPLISIIKEERNLQPNPNTLPYLHRNPSI